MRTFRVTDEEFKLFAAGAELLANAAREREHREASRTDPQYVLNCPGVCGGAGVGPVTNHRADLLDDRSDLWCLDAGDVMTPGPPAANARPARTSAPGVAPQRGHEDYPRAAGLPDTSGRGYSPSHVGTTGSGGPYPSAEYGGYWDPVRQNRTAAMDAQAEANLRALGILGPEDEGDVLPLPEMRYGREAP